MDLTNTEKEMKRFIEELLKEDLSENLDKEHAKRLQEKASVVSKYPTNDYIKNFKK